MQELKKIVAKSLEKAIGEKGFDEKAIIQLLEQPPSRDLGDVAFPAFKLAGLMKKKPTEIAQKLAGKIKPLGGIKQVKAIGPYVNFFFEENFLEKITLEKVFKDKKFGENKSNKGKRILIEYSQPNTNKPLHVGHLRNNAIGMSTARHMEMTGAKVTKVDLFNDRGIHICQSMLAYKKWGNNSTPEEANVKSDHFVGTFYVMYHDKEKEMPELKEELNEMLLKWEKGDKETHELWKKMNAWAEKGFMQTYKEFGSEFDYRFYESKIFDKAKPIIEKGLVDNVFYRDENNAVMADLEKWSLGKKTILRGDGTSIYITQDLALAVEKQKKFKPDKSIYVVASEQNTYFKQLFKVIELLGFEWHEKLFHLSYGLVNLPEGKLKSREGKIIDADKLMEDVKELARQEIITRYQSMDKKELEKRAKAIALAAIKFYMLKTDAVKDILFETNKAVSFEGDTGPYVMYTYARAKSIEKKAKKAKKAGQKHEISPEEKNVLSLIAVFPEKIQESVQSLSPHKTAGYLLELCAAFNSFYHAHKVINENNEYNEERLKIVQATTLVIKKGLYALNIGVLEEM